MADTEVGYAVLGLYFYCHASQQNISLAFIPFMRHRSSTPPTARPRLSGEEACAWLARLVWEATQTANACAWEADDYPCANQLAHQTGLLLDAVKKQLKALTAMGRIKPMTMSPKRYRWIDREEPTSSKIDNHEVFS